MRGDGCWLIATIEFLQSYPPFDRMEREALVSRLSVSAQPTTQGYKHRSPG
jgi:hypothetical protein